MFLPTDLVCDVLQRHPEAFSVFERHGMCEDCRQSPPPVPIAHFAEKHCDGRVEAFISELSECVGASDV
ncbi:MAG: hypothetical protein GC154_10315 [bacterium]|nr:hypothetical protein [bacterium]